MKLSFSTNAFVRHSVFDAVECIAAVGYSGVELLADAPHLYADSIADSDLDRLAGILERTNLHVANINANTAMGYYGRDFWEPLFEPSLANPDRNLRQWRIDYTRKCIDIAARLGSPCISVTSGKPVPGTEPNDSLELLSQSLDLLLDYAVGKSIRIGIEYEPGLLIERYEEISGMIDRVKSDALGVNLDLGHSHVLGEVPDTVIRALSQRIFHIHVEDIRDGKHYHLVPGAGDMDFPGIFRCLSDFGFDGFVSVELYTYPNNPQEVAEKSFSYLKDAWNFG